MTHRFHIVDVFAERRYSGNQLAVVIGPDALPVETMQAIAADVDYSETTFVSPVAEPDGGYRVRIFTPAREIAFAGHPLLGTAVALRRQLGADPAQPLQINLSVGPVEVTFDRSAAGDEVAWFRAPPVALGRTAAREAMAAALGIEPGDIDPRSPVQQAAAGTAAMIVPLRTLDAVKRGKLDLERYAPLAAAGCPPLVYLWCRQTHDPANDVCARFFFEAHGVREDPASGNAAAFLGAYLLEHRLQPASGFSLRIEQGHEVRRPSLVLLQARNVDGTREIRVGGAVIPTVAGELV